MIQAKNLTDNVCNQGFHLVLGGARSGKSSFAESCAKTIEDSSNCAVVYVATATAGDGEMVNRIAHHQQQRPEHWLTYEEPVYLAQRLQTIQQQNPQAVILVDCLTLWLTNCLLSEDAELWSQQRQALLDTLARLTNPIIMVSNEVGWGIVPMGEINRRFVDEAGRLHQQLARLAQQVSLVVAGLPMQLKTTNPL